MVATSTTKPLPDQQTAPGRADHGKWCTVVWDDPINTMGYVTEVFRTYFGYTQEKARNLMLQVHNRGRATVSTGMREHMEADVYAMHSFGLKATIEPVASDAA